MNITTIFILIDLKKEWEREVLVTIDTQKKHTSSTRSKHILQAFAKKLKI